MEDPKPAGAGNSEKRPTTVAEVLNFDRSLRDIAKIGKIVDPKERFQALVDAGRKLGFVRESD